MTKIEWTDEVWNVITGCNRLCLDSEGRIYCYAYYMAQRLKGRFGYDLFEPFKPTFHEDRLGIPSKWKKPRKIFVDSMGDLFAPGIKPAWIHRVLDVMRQNPQHKFQVLTKFAPRAFEVLSDLKLPDNLWLGCSQDGHTTDMNDTTTLSLLDPAVCFVSFEPLLDRIPVWSMSEGNDWSFSNLDWIIIGAKTGAAPEQPKREWVEDIIGEARTWGLPVFLKNNLEGFRTLQEVPT